jgi:glycosyltransferase involved in cell wall biosynthesis
MYKIKIIFFSISGAGVKRHLLDLALNLDREKYEVVGIFPDKMFSNIVSKAPEFTYRGIFQKAGLRYYILEIPRELSPWLDLKAVWELRKILRTERPDILHCHSSVAGALGRLAVFSLSRLKPKIIYTPNLMYHQQAQGLKRSLYWAVEKMLWPLAGAIIAVGESEYDALARDFAPAKNLLRINNSIDTETGIHPFPDAKEKLCKELDLKQDALFVLSLARLEPQKDVLTLLKAFVLIAEKYPRAVLLMAGGGKEEQIQEARRLIDEANLSRRTFLLGWRDDSDMLLSAADIAVLSTHCEGLPYVLLEAMAFGKPLVGSRAQGVVDCIVHGCNGYLFDIGDTKSCAASLERLLQDSALRKRFGAAGKELVERKFALKDMLQATEKLYAEPM